MSRPALLLPVALAFALAACGDGPGTNVSIDATGDGNARVTSDGNGQIAIKSDGFEGSFKIPKITVNAEQFDLNGVKLYPGSVVTDFNIASGGASEKDKGSVKVTFDGPADVATVATWFRDGMTARGFTVAADGTGLKGMTDEGDPFTLSLSADGDRKARGVLEVRG